MEKRDGTAEPGLVDAEDFLGFTTRLREAHGRIDGARVSGEKKSRWQRRLIAIADAGQRDLQQAGELLRRFEAELDKQA